MRLVSRFQRLDPAYRTLLPNHRIVEAEFPDLDLVYHAEWQGGSLSDVKHGPAPRSHIRVECSSDDLMRMARGELSFRRAYATNRVRVEASMTDLLRLRGVMS